MILLIACLLVLLSTQHWFFACLLVGIYFFHTRNRTREAREGSSTKSSPEEMRDPPQWESPLEPLDQGVCDLAVLRLELARLLANGDLDRSSYDELTKHIDTASLKTLGVLSIVPDGKDWKHMRDAAWELLALHEFVPPAPPPWKCGDLPEGERALGARHEHAVQDLTGSLFEDDESHGTTPIIRASHAPLEPQASISTSPLSAEFLTVMDEGSVGLPPQAMSPFPIEAAQGTPELVLPTTSPGRTEEHIESIAHESSPDQTASYALKPPVPSAMERLLQALSGWPSLIAPFLVQNIGWFIGGLCFIAGSVFLVSYTTGFTKALTVSGVLLLYTLFIFWAAYQLRRRRPELVTSSSVLFSVGVLLAPLCVAASVRVIATAQSAPGLLIGILAAAGGLGGLTFATTLVSGIMDRCLQGRHPHLFLGLAAMQLAVPVLSHFPSWPLLAMFHLLLVGVLAHGLVLFTREWLHSIFIEQRKTAYYAAGTLVYAALVSFVHLTWGYKHPLALPAGYYSPFLMVLCGLLFYVDAQLKKWTRQYAFLSRFTFAIYGLSVLALSLSVHTPAARLITLLLAIGLYGMVVWQYLTLMPLYLLLACLGWLYGLVILQFLPGHWHLLGSLPGLAGLFAANRWLERRQSTCPALVCYLTFMGATIVLTGWSLLHANPGLVASGTILATMGVVFHSLKFAPGRLFGSTQHAGHTVNLRDGPWLYAVTLMGSVAVAYAPDWTELSRSNQCALGLVLLASFWAALGLRLRPPTSETETAKREVLLNSSLLNLLLCFLTVVMLALPHITQSRALPFLLAMMGGVSLWLSLELRQRWLFYGFLGLGAAAGTIFKLTYFPGLGTGTIQMLLALAAWALLWWLMHEPDEIKDLRQEQARLLAAQHTPLKLLWRFPVFTDQTHEQLLRTPLQQAMALLWAIGVLHLGARLLESRLGWGWALSGALGALVSILGGGLLRLSCALSVSVLLGLGAWLFVLSTFGVSTLGGLSLGGAAYALFTWRLNTHVLTHSMTPRLSEALHLGGDGVSAEKDVHRVALVITGLSILLSFLRYNLFIPNETVPLTIAVSMVFLWLAGQHHHGRIHSYALLTIGVLGVLQCSLWVLPLFSPRYPLSVQELLEDNRLALFLALSGLSFWAIARWLSTLAGETGAFDADFHGSLYRKPIRVVAFILALCGAGHQIALAWSDPIHEIVSLPVGVMILASAGLLLANHALRHFSLNLLGILLAGLATLWAQASWFHSGAAFTLLPIDRVFSDRWLTLSLLALGFAVLKEKVGRHPFWKEQYHQPLQFAAFIGWSWALLSALGLSAMAPLHGDIFLSLTFLTLTLSLFPILKSLPRETAMRGIGVPLLGSTFVASALILVGLTYWSNVTALLWGFTLWGLGNFVLPRCNSRWPRWACAPAAWPWLGLVAVSFGLTGGISGWNASASTISLAGYLGAVAVYLFLMLRNNSWPGFPWLTALLLTCAGLALNMAWLGPLLSLRYHELTPLSLSLPLSCVVASIVWANLLLQVVPLWRQHGRDLFARWGWCGDGLTSPFLVWPSVPFCLWLLQLFALEANAILPLVRVPHGTHHISNTLVGALLTLSFLHAWWLNRGEWESHAILFSLFCTLLAGWLGIFSQSLHPLPFLALWSAALVLAHSVMENRQWGSQATLPFRDAVSMWTTLSLAVALGALIFIPERPLGERLVSLGILIGAAAGLGWKRQQSGWFLAALAMFLVLLHSWPLLWTPLSAVTLLFPWYALQSALLAWLLLWANDHAQRRLEKGGQGQVAANDVIFQELALPLSWAPAAVAVISLGEWALHCFSAFTTLAAGRQQNWLTGSGDAVAALLAALLILVQWIRQAKRSQKAVWIYGITALGGAIGLYIRLLLAGLAPPSVWDTAALMGATYVIFLIQQITSCRQLLHVVLVLPLLALFTVPAQLASNHAGATLVSAGALYLLTHLKTVRPLPLYLALLAFNAAVYLWVPGWANSCHVFQVYVVPAAISVLLLLHLHRRELKPNVLNSARLATTSILYASATLDVFLRGDLMIFAVMLVLSLAGIVTGIALRTRAFLYSGVTFLVFNVLGQLLLLFPEQRLGKAIILLVLGTAITGGMIWFNLQREMILQQVRIFRADIDSWS